MKVLVLDIDGTLVEKETWINLVKGAVALASAPYLFCRGMPVAAGAALFVGVSSFCSVPIFEPARELVKRAKTKEYEIYVNTSRPWPFVSLNVLKLLWIKPSHIYFRSARTGVISKIKNMNSIWKQSECKKEDIVFVEDESENVTAVRNQGFKVIFTPDGIRDEDIDQILETK